MKQTLQWILLVTVGIYVDEDPLSKSSNLIFRMLKHRLLRLNGVFIESLHTPHELIDSIEFTFDSLSWTWTEEKGWTES